MLEIMKTLYHIACREDWEKSKAAGVYSISTLGKRLEEVGYIHMSFAPQVKKVANFIYKETPDLVLLKIDPQRLQVEVKVESLAGTEEEFPHLYGPLNVAAVTNVSDYRLEKSGEFPEVTETR